MLTDTVLAQAKEQARLERAAKREDDNQTMPTTPQTIYVLGGVVFVPHYALPDMFVAPGNRMHSHEFLLHLGATPGQAALWPR